MLYRFPGQASSPKEEYELLPAGVRLYLILGCIAGLVFIAIVQATCTIIKTRRTNRLKVWRANLLDF